MRSDSLYLGRQPILNRGQKIYGFELLFRNGNCEYADITDYLQACASVINDALTGFGISGVLGRHKGFINVNRDLLLSDAVELLPKGQVVIELLESIFLDDEVVKRCRELKRKGFALALDDHVYSAVNGPIYGQVKIVKLDVLQIRGAELQDMVTELKRWPCRLLAEKVETEETFRHCYDLGFNYFQGYYFARPALLKHARVDIPVSSLIRLLDLVLSDAETVAIEQTFRENPGLTYSLLRLVNSVSVGMREKIRTLRHAIVVLGREHLMRWILLAVYACRDARGVMSPLLETAAMRARLMEVLAMEDEPEKSFGESAFLTGVLSLMDSLFEIPMEEIVTGLNVTDEVRFALLRREGDLGKLLLLAEKLEFADFSAITALAAERDLSSDRLLAAQAEAINWSSSLSEQL